MANSIGIIADETRSLFGSLELIRAHGEPFAYRTIGNDGLWCEAECVCVCV